MRHLSTSSAGQVTRARSIRCRPPIRLAKAGALSSTYPLRPPLHCSDSGACAACFYVFWVLCLCCAVNFIAACLVWHLCLRPLCFFLERRATALADLWHFSYFLSSSFAVELVCLPWSGVAAEHSGHHSCMLILTCLKPVPIHEV